MKKYFAFVILLALTPTVHAVDISPVGVYDGSTFEKVIIFSDISEQDCLDNIEKLRAALDKVNRIVLNHDSSCKQRGGRGRWLGEISFL